MADNYKRITTSNQTEKGSSSAELFEIVPSESKLENLSITTGGGNDTIKIVDSKSVGLAATVSGFSSDTKLDLSETKNYGTILLAKQDDGILMTDSNNKFSIKFAGLSDDSIFNSNYVRLVRESTAEGRNIIASNYNDTITVNHPQCYATGDSGNDFITAKTDNNTLNGGYGNDVVIATGHQNQLHDLYHFTSYGSDSGNDTLISSGNKNYLADNNGKNVFIVGGDENTAIGGNSADDFFVYSYGASNTNVTLTGGGNNDNYTISSGLVGVEGLNVNSASYKTGDKDTINVAITDLDSLDSLYIRNKGMTALKHDVAAEGITISDDTGRIKIFLLNQRDWDEI